jgi:hypothetical protein
MNAPPDSSRSLNAERSGTKHRREVRPAASRQAMPGFVANMLQESPPWPKWSRCVRSLRNAAG